MSKKGEDFQSYNEKEFGFDSEEEKEAVQSQEAVQSEEAVQSNSSYSLLLQAGKKVFFLTSMPFYWFVFFKHIVGWFDISFFITIIFVSLILSYLRLGWGVLDGMMY